MDQVARLAAKQADAVEREEEKPASLVMNARAAMYRNGRSK